MFVFFTFLLACGPCPSGEALCDEQCIQVEATSAFLSENIFSKSCAFSSCHSNASSASAGLQLHDEPSLLALINKPSAQDPNKMLILPKDPQNSYLVKKMRGENIAENTDSMPPNASLCEAKIELVEEWILGLE